MREQERELVVRVVVFDDHRRREIAQQRRQRPFRDVDERERLFRFGEFEHTCRVRRGGRFAFETQRQIRAVRPDQADRERDQQRTLLRFARGGRAFAVTLRERHRVTTLRGIVSGFHRHARRTSLAVPALVLREVAAVRVGHRVTEVVAGHRLAVVALEVQVHAFAKTVAAEQRLIHPHDFRAFLVDRHRVEVVDLDVALRAHRVRHRAGVFGELHLAQHAHVFDALGGAGGFVGRAAGHVGGEFLVAEHRQAFLQAQLEPVAARHAIAGPVMEVLVADHRLDVREVGVGRRFGVCQHVLGVEDVEPLVLHRAHVEVAHGDDHEAVQIEFEPEALFVPADRVFQRIHRVLGLVEIVRLDPHLQQLFLAGAGLHAFLERNELARDQREQIARLPERVFPAREVAAVGQLALLDQVAV